MSTNQKIQGEQRRKAREAGKREGTVGIAASLKPVSATGCHFQG